jgi:hypothetical protein
MHIKASFSHCTLRLSSFLETAFFALTSWKASLFMRETHNTQSSTTILFKSDSNDRHRLWILAASFSLMFTGKEKKAFLVNQTPESLLCSRSFPFTENIDFKCLVMRRRWIEEKIERTVLRTIPTTWHLHPHVSWPFSCLLERRLLVASN